MVLEPTGMSLFTFSPPPMLRRPLPLYQAGIAWFSSTLLSAIFIYILPVGKVQRRHNVYRSWMKGSQSRMSHLADRRPNLATRVNTTVSPNQYRVNIGKDLNKIV